MKTYPSIFGYPQKFLNLSCVGFDKLDGSNIRAEYSNKQGWYKFGTRRCRIDKSNTQFGPAIDVFYEQLAEGIEKVFKAEKIDRAVCFFEYFGPSSFADFHDFNEKFEGVLFDVSIHKKGFVLPKQFIELFGHLKIPKVVYEGPLTEEFINSVRSSEFPVKEGVVAKGIRPGSASEQHRLFMTKIKTKWWLDELRRRKESMPEIYAEAYKDNVDEQSEEN